jgi:tetratricopeptide (TPR) repeat protein
MSQTRVQTAPAPTASAPPPSVPAFFSRRDKLAFGLAAGMSFAAYLYTLAPSVTLEDSGEFVAAAYSLGVPHPPGYPIWTILAWLWQKLIPFGNIAWRVNLMSAFFGALAAGLTALLVSKGGHVMAGRVGLLQRVNNQRELDTIILASAVAAAMMLALTPVLWSQSVITEVYSLNAFFLMATLSLLYRWSFEPRRRGLLYAAALVWGVSLTNHQTLVLLTIAFPLFVWLVEKRLGRDMLVPVLAVFIVGLLVANLATQEQIIDTLARIPGMPQPLTVLDIFLNLGEPAIRPLLFPLFVQTLMIVSAGMFLYVLAKQGGWQLLVLWALIGLACWATASSLLRASALDSSKPTFGGGMLVLSSCALSMSAWLWILYCFRRRDWRLWVYWALLAIAVVVGVAGLRHIAESSQLIPEVAKMQEAMRAGPMLALGLLLFWIAAGWAFYSWTINVRRVRVWHRAVTTYGAVILGLSLYVYMPVASATNPPMNWGYTRTFTGFRHHFTRGQYEQVKTERLVSRAVEQVQMFLEDIVSQFNLVYALLAVIPFCFYRHLDRRSRKWLLFLAIGYLFLTFGFLYLSNPAIEKQKQFTDRVFFLPGHCLYALCIGYGLILGLGALLAARPELRLWTPALATAVFVLPFWWALGFLIPERRPDDERPGPGLRQWLLSQWADNEQRGHYFGYQFGYLMFKPGGGYPEMERGAVLFGGTDPGRFIPTYMIFVESQAPPRAKTWMPQFPESRSFDRSDVYIITQNALADGTYMNYIRDHYGHNRPDPARPETLQHWPGWQRRVLKAAWRPLGRDRAYPEQTLWLPGELEVAEAFKLHFEQTGGQGGQLLQHRDGQMLSIRGVQEVMAINGTIAQMIFEKNKQNHTFYVEESYVLEWMYPYLQPYGIILKLNPEPLEELSPETVARDRAYWDDLYDQLINDPRYQRDDVAQKTYAKLRSAIGGLYTYRRMFDEAEYALQQAVNLCKESPEANYRLASLYCDMERFDEAVAVFERYQRHDPKNDKIRGAVEAVRSLRAHAADIRRLERELADNPDDYQAALRLLGHYWMVQRRADMDRLAEELVARPDISSNDFAELIKFYAERRHLAHARDLLDRFTERFPDNAQGWFSLAVLNTVFGEHQRAIPALEKTVALDPRNVEAWYNLGILRALDDQCDAAAEAIEKVIALAGEPGRRQIIEAPQFRGCLHNQRVQAAVRPRAPAAQFPIIPPPER